MSFVTKEWKDRLAEFAGRRKLTNVSTGEEMIVDVARNEGTVSQEGDAFSAANMNDLEQRVADEFNNINTNLTADGLQFKFRKDGEGNYGFLGADGSLIPFSKGIKELCTAVSCNSLSIGVFFDYDNKNLSTIGGNSGTGYTGQYNGRYLKLDCYIDLATKSQFTVTALKDGKYNIIDSNGVYTAIDAKAGDVLITSTPPTSNYVSHTYCTVWI